ncbi:MAG: TIGR01459 family HAD-type hydrolase [Beijerinckiaceae bacterium]|nr:TIGR01459 family HAD-type hydrolase [Beijerinckiaceae bacterium]
MTSLTPLVSGLSGMMDRYDAIISDVWGVLHNGVSATPGAGEALKAARESGKAVVLLTNAPRPPDSIRRQLTGFGVIDGISDAIVSSGGVTRDLLAREGEAPFYHLGPARDRAIYEGLAARPVSLDEARLILCSGLFDDETEQAEDYRPMLEEARRRNLQLICANPDLVVERGSDLLPCAGALADLYEKLGGETIWVGKPHPLVYRYAREAIEQTLGRQVDPARILCIGDALRTDVAGAGAAGHDCLMTLAGIHGHEINLDQGRFNRDLLEALIATHEKRPIAVAISLVW